ncbi:ABC transporter ATP-binding protein [Micromonospora sp. NBC_01813]|uniref:ABC transporter ATP-binding protein n=1 Tax=Micromonospora sp. NBC_01813 TaxID=2975988 RepID=UPI002DDA795D|nr:ABC transporter ATP-binding protein [Micromonospora sp. NBC_01813]WSA07136.1 ABC transporter ATP-binding protein/permease [Micromonospora sp. NBC_01813]
MRTRNHGTLRMLGPLLGRNWRGIWAAAALAALAQGVMASLPLIQKIIVDDAVLDSRKSLAPWIAILLVAGCLGFAGNYLRRSIGNRAAARSQRDLQIRVHRHMQHLDAAGRDTFRAGDVMSRATSDLTVIQMFLADIGLAAGNIATLLVAVVVMFALSVQLALILAVAAPVLYLLTTVFRTRSFAASFADQQYLGAVAGVVEEAVTGVRVVKAFGQEQQEQESLRGVARQLFQSKLRTARIVARFSALMGAAPGLTQLAVLGYGGWLVMRGSVTLGVFLAFASYVVLLMAPMRMLSGVVATSQQARAGAARVIELLSIRSNVEDRADAVPLGESSGDVELDHVDFAYPGGEPVLHDICLRVRPGERVAIVGASGSGKSTLALLLARFHDPSSGTVRIDGRDARDYTLASLRSAVGLVFEEAFLFSTSIRDNIALGRPHACGDDVEHAAAIAHAHGFVAALPEGYRTVVGERGYTLSGGQRQRIALARVALTNPQVLILDDATSAIDTRTEHAIHHSFGQRLALRTTILIAKRFSTLRLADRVIVLDGGRVVDEGTSDELAERSTLFRELMLGAAESPPPERSVPRQDQRSAEVAKPPPPVGTIDRAAWPTDVPREGAAKVSSFAAGLAGQVMGWGGGGMAADNARLAGLAASSSAQSREVAKLPPLLGDPAVDIDASTAPHDDYTMRTVLRPFTKPLLLAGLLVVVDAATGLAAPALIRVGVDRAIVRDSLHVLLVVCAGMLALQLVSLVNAWVMSFFTQRTAERVLFSLRLRTFAHLQRLSLNFYEQHPAGKIMTRMTSDVQAFAQLIQQGLITATVSLLTCLGIAIVLTVLDPPLALAVAPVLIPAAIGTWWFRRASMRTYLLSRERIALLYAEMQESFAGVMVSQAYGQQARNEARFAALAESYCRSRIRSGELMARFLPFLQLLSTVAKAIALGVGAHSFANGDLTLGVLIAFLLYLDQFFTPIQQLSQVFDQWLQANVAVAQLRELLRTPTATPSATRPVAPGRLRGRIMLDRVSFAYESTGLVAMDDVSLTIPAGQVVALVGTTGAGKSTLVKLVSRFYDPTRGDVLIDGVPLRELDLGAYRRQLGYVPQEPFLFSGTIRSNIAYGRPSATDLEVERAARAVGAHEFIAGLAAGYLTPVSEQGRSLSAGQRQLLSLARALLVDPAILLLDEATANLDLATEAKVQRAMGLVASGRTTLLIAHRLRTAQAAQRILVVDNGRIVEDGSHEHLIARGGRYADLWGAAQQRGGVDAVAEV